MAHLLAQNYLVAERKISADKDPREAYSIVNYGLITRNVPQYKQHNSSLMRKAKTIEKLNYLLSVPWIVPILGPEVKNTLVIEGKQVTQFLSTNMNVYIPHDVYRRSLEADPTACLIRVAADVKDSPEKQKVVEKLKKSKKPKKGGALSPEERDKPIGGDFRSPLVIETEAFEDIIPATQKTADVSLYPDEMRFVAPSATEYMPEQTLELPTIFEINLLKDKLVSVRRMVKALDGKYTVYGLVVDHALLGYDTEYANFSNVHSGRMDRIIAINSILESGESISRYFPQGGVFPRDPNLLAQPLRSTWHDAVQGASICGFEPTGIHPFYDWVRDERTKTSVFSMDPTSIDISIFIDYLYSRVHQLFAWATNSSLRHIRVPVARIPNIGPGAAGGPAALPLAGGPAALPLMELTRGKQSALINRIYLRHILSANGTIDLKRIMKLVSTKKIDYDRYKDLVRLAWEIRKDQDATNTKKLLAKFLKEVTLTGRQYRDKESDLVVICEHDLYAIRTGKSTITEFGAIADNQFETICKVCGQSLVTDWLGLVPMAGLNAGESKYSDDTFITLGRLLDYNVIQTQMPRSELFIAIAGALGDGFLGELKKIQSLFVKDRINRQRFIVLSGVISFLAAASKQAKSKLFPFSAMNLRRMIRTEYIDLLLGLGFSLEVAIAKIIDYWGSGIGKYYANPKEIIDNFLKMVLGIPNIDTAIAINSIPIMYALGPVIKEKHFKDITMESLDKAKSKHPMYAWSKLFIGVMKGDEASIKEMKKLMLDGKYKSTYKHSLYTPVKKRGTINRVTGIKAHPDIAELKKLFATELVVICPARKDAFLPHEWKADKKCQYCGISKSLDFTDAYYKKYSSFILDKWLVPKNPAPPIETVLVKHKERKVTLEKAIDRKLLLKFTAMYIEPPILSSKPYLDELAGLLGAIGYAVLIEPVKSNTKNAVNTAWNRIMAWGLETQEKEWLKRQLIYLRKF